MALNKYMHPRNIYKHRKPDFEALALKYPEFRKYVFPDLTGKYFLDFKHVESLRQLTLTLLKDDYGLDLELPLDRLIPTIPLRLNYIHWIEDIMTGSKAAPDVRGIDIGTGSSCIYPLLSCKLNPKWQFCASEIDDQNYEFALKNVEKNGYADKIKVKKVPEDTVLQGVILDSQDTYDFCMCNPPFFADHLEAQAVMKSRNYSRSSPKSVCSADFKESVVEGGEVQFVKKIIHDSLILKSKVRVYTSMVGKKASLPAIKEELRNSEVIKYSTTEFCQGKTMRWGVAWTFDPKVVFPKSLFQEHKKEKPPLTYSVPASVPGLSSYSVPGITDKVQQILDQLKIAYEVLKQEASVVSMSAVAKENTWSHQRRKRREIFHQRVKQDTTKSADIQKMEVTAAPETTSPAVDLCQHSAKLSGVTVDTGTIDSATVQKIDKAADRATPTSVQKNETGETTGCGAAPTQVQHEPHMTGETTCDMTSTVVQCEKEHNISEMYQDQDDITGLKMSNRKRKLSGDTDAQCVIKRNKSEVDDEEKSDKDRHVGDKRTSELSLPVEQVNMTTSPTTSATDDLTSDTRPDEICDIFQEDIEEKFLLKFKVTIKKIPCDIVLEMAWIDGVNRELMHQVMQFFKNKLK